jgi:hypothetical protein
LSSKKNIENKLPSEANIAQVLKSCFEQTTNKARKSLRSAPIEPQFSKHYVRAFKKRQDRFCLQVKGKNNGNVVATEKDVHVKITAA